jgi:hypothetical protein
MMIGVIIGFTIVQFVISLIGAIWCASDYHSRSTNSYSYTSHQVKSSAKWTKIWVLFLATSPISIVALPIIVIGMLVWGIKSFVQFLIPALTYEAK